MRRMLSRLEAVFCRLFRRCGAQGERAPRGYRSPRELFEGEHIGGVGALHRTLLWDDCEPPGQMGRICAVRRRIGKSPVFLWNAQWAERLVRQSGLEFYFDYPRDIMRADLIRYLILDRFGGFYLDFDVRLHAPLSSFERVVGTGEEYCLLFEEHRWSPGEGIDESREPIRHFLEERYRREAPVRVANYAMAATPGHPFIRRVLEECRRRAHLRPRSDYDVLFITGPDVVSHVYHTADPAFLAENNVRLIPLEKRSGFLSHYCDGTWRQGRR